MSDDRRTMADLAREALGVQDACNLSGLVLSFGKSIQRLRVLLEERGEGSTTRLNRHPVCVLWIDKLRSLSGDDFSEAYGWANAEIAADATASVTEIAHPLAGVRCGALTVDERGVWRA